MSTKIHIRLDDFPYGTPEDKFKYNQAQLYSKLDVFEDACIQYTLGVTPELLCLHDIDKLKQLQFAQFGLHGFNHGLDKWRPSDKDGGEFVAMTREDILGKFIKNIDVIHRFNFEVFIPPFNVFTQELLDVLNETPMRIITGGAETIEHNLTNLHFGNIKLFIAMKFYDKSRALINRIPSITEGEIIGLHIPWESKEDLIDFVQVIKDNNLETVHYAIT